jgi:hypothetical protein
MNRMSKIIFKINYYFFFATLFTLCKEVKMVPMETPVGQGILFSGKILSTPKVFEKP